MDDPARGAVRFGDDSQIASELEAERQRLDDILRATDAGTWEWNVLTGAVKFNERWASMLGYTLESLGPLNVCNTWMRLTHPEDMARCQQALQHHFEGKSALYECSFRMRHRLGHWVWILARGKVASRTLEAQIEWMLGTHLEISSFKNQQAHLRETQGMLQRISETAAIGGYEADIDRDTLSPALQTCKLLDLNPFQTPTLSVILNRLEPSDRRRLIRAALRGRRTGQAWQLDVAAPTRSRTRKMLHVTGRHEVDTDKGARTIGSVQDVSARYADRARLDAALKRLSAASMASGMGVWSMDLSSGVLQGDPPCLRMLGLRGRQGKLTPRKVLRGLDRDDCSRLLGGLRETLTLQATYQDEVRVISASGPARHVRCAAIVERDPFGRAVSITGAVWDITASRELERRLNYQQRLLQVTLDSIADAVVTTGPTGTPEWMNSAAAQLLSRTSERPGSLPREVEEAARTCMKVGSAVWSEGPMRIDMSDGDAAAIDYSTSPIHLATERPHGAVVVMRNVTHQQRTAEAMAWRASHDPLTDLLNRSEFELRLGAALAATSDPGLPHALLYLDLDQFKLVNDACGHMVGDNLLKEVAAMISESVRAGDTVARLGGDEFAIIMAGCDAEQGRRAAEAVCNRLEHYRFQHEGRRFRVSASIGLVTIEGKSFADAGSILKAADAACFAAKDSGRNRVHTWLVDDAAILERNGEMQWAARIEQALDENRFELHGQRIVPLKAGETGLHVETLLRMREPDGQLISPGAFIPAAERFNLCTRVDAWVVRAVLRWLRSIEDLDHISMVSVNLSGLSVGDPLFRADVVGLLHLQPAELRRRICFEITETAAVTNMDNAKALVDQVRHLGVSVALDDFGAGASSFGYLRQLKVDILKIDGQYVRDLLDDPLDSVAIKCFVEVAKATGLRTVAEFVEREDVLEELKRIGVDFGQGYLIHRPEPLHRIAEAWISQITNRTEVNVRPLQKPIRHSG